MEDNAAVEIHDSTLECIEFRIDALIAVLSAYVHSSSGRPRIDAGTGWSKTLHLRFHRGRASGNVDMVSMDEASGERFDNLIPMPFSRVGPTKIELHGWNGTSILIEGDSVEATFIGRARYVEQISASKSSKQ